MATKQPAWDLVKGPNETLILDIAVPGLRKEDLEATFDRGILRVKTVTAPSTLDKYLRKEIPEHVDGKWEVGNQSKIDMITCADGILRVLISTIMDIPKSNRIQIQ